MKACVVTVRFVIPADSDEDARQQVTEHLRTCTTSLPKEWSIKILPSNLGRAVCYFCNKEIAWNEAEAFGWIPYFYTRSDLEEGPVCVSCADKHLMLSDEDSEWQERRD